MDEENSQQPAPTDSVENPNSVVHNDDDVNQMEHEIVPSGRGTLYDLLANLHDAHANDAVVAAESDNGSNHENNEANNVNLMEQETESSNNSIFASDSDDNNDDDDEENDDIENNDDEMPIVNAGDANVGDGAQGNEDADMNDGIRLIAELNELNVLLNDLSGRASRIAEQLVDTVEEASSASSASNGADLSAENPAAPVRVVVEDVVRRVNAGEIGLTDGVLARLRRMVFRLDGRLQRRGQQLNSSIRAANSQNTSDGASGESQPEEHSDIESPSTPNAIIFDTNLPAEHSYLGENMSRVSGVNYLETGKTYKIMLFMHQHLLFPGEILPFMISENILETEEVDSTNGLLFGVCFPFMSADRPNVQDVYGVTCHIYEKGTDESGNMLIKSRALQRFIMNKDAFTGHLQYIASHPRFKCHGLVKILPEIFLPEPLKCINMGSLNRFRDNASMHDMYKRHQAASTPWPAFVYDYYSISAIVEKARSMLAQHKIETMPTDPIQLSFWLVRNLHLPEDLARVIFATDSVNIRMKLIANSFKEDGIFVCRYCGNCIAECRELFAMSKYGVQTQYCNSAGYIHETNTVYRVSQNAISFSGYPSTEFSWFPGYQWHIINCQVCTRHIGWQFKALEPNLIPKMFYGISSSSVRIRTQPEVDTQADMYRGLVRLARRYIE